MNKVTLILFSYLLSLNLYTAEPLSLQPNPEESILFWDKDQKIEGFKNGYKFIPSRIIHKSSKPYPLNYLLLDFSVVGMRKQRERKNPLHQGWEYFLLVSLSSHDPDGVGYEIT